MKKVKCIRDVVMMAESEDGQEIQTDEVAFVEGKEYPVIHISPRGGYIEVLNEQEERHGLSHSGDKWFQEHFEAIYE